MDFVLLFLRSTVFNFSFYLVNAFQMIFWIPTFFFLSKENRWKIVKIWAYSLLWLQHKICNNVFDFSGLENIPKSKNLLVAGKHQSSWETYTVVLFFDDPAYILKRSLMSIPLFGWYVKKMRSVPIDRGSGSLALASITSNATTMMAEDKRQIIIYPEGTRKISGAPAKYKYGITHLYTELQKPVIPFALNSGMFWSRQSFLRYPGKISMHFLPAIMPGLDKNTFSKKLEEVIEKRSNSLQTEAAKANSQLPYASKFS